MESLGSARGLRPPAGLAAPLQGLEDSDDQGWDMPWGSPARRAPSCSSSYSPAGTGVSATVSARTPGRDGGSGRLRYRPQGSLGVRPSRSGLGQDRPEEAASEGSLGSWDATRADSSAPLPCRQPGRPSSPAAQQTHLPMIFCLPGRTPFLSALSHQQVGG